MRVSARPYRIYDAKAKVFLRSRCYKHPKNAHRGALIELRWSKVGTVLEVINNDLSRRLVSYKLHATGHITWS